MKICSIEGCENQVRARGWCIKHYKRWAKHGDPLYSLKEYDPICIIEGCNNNHRSKGYCTKHYARFRKYGDPLFVEEIKICKIEGCNLKARASGYCQRHYRKLYRYGDPLFTKIDREQENHGMTNTPEYKVWAGMKQRCLNPKNKFYHRYGGRGITVCDRWNNSFLAFFEDMGLRPTPKHQIDRKENDKGYYKDNCQWLIDVENTRKKPQVKLSMRKADEIRKQYKAGNITQKQLALIHNVGQTIISNIIKDRIWKNNR